MTVDTGVGVQVEGGTIGVEIAASTHPDVESPVRASSLLVVEILVEDFDLAIVAQRSKSWRCFGSHTSSHSTSESFPCTCVLVGVVAKL